MSRRPLDHVRGQARTAAGRGASARPEELRQGRPGAPAEACPARAAQGRQEPAREPAGAGPRGRRPRRHGSALRQRTQAREARRERVEEPLDQGRWAG
jgi:hypothetical protein